MRPHQWTFLAVADASSTALQGWTARVIGVCSSCGLTRVLEVAGHHDARFDLSGACQTAIESAEERRVARATG